MTDPVDNTTVSTAVEVPDRRVRGEHDVSTFVLTVTPPRPSFALDATEAEREIVAHHAGHWQPYIASGRMVLFGPVLDNGRSYGLAVIETDDEDELRRHAAEDPAVAAGVAEISIGTMLGGYVRPAQPVAQGQSQPLPSAVHGLVLQPLVHVQDMTASVGFYEQLGGRLLDGSREGDWALLDIAGAQLSLLAHPPNPEQREGAVELTLQVHGSLEGLEDDLRRAGVTIAQPVSDAGFGRQLQITSPDGLLIKLNELDPDAYR